jgi:class 3 adenylate cyclase
LIQRLPAAVAAVQKPMAYRTAGVAEDRRIAFRIGINLGDLIVEGDDLHGDRVKVAACLESQALISRAVHEAAAGRRERAGIAGRREGSKQ